MVLLILSLSLFIIFLSIQDRRYPVEERKHDSAMTLWRRDNLFVDNLLVIFSFKASRRKKFSISLESISQEGSHLSHSPTHGGG